MNAAATRAAVDALRISLRTTASAEPQALHTTAKDLGVLVKLLRNPAERPEEVRCLPTKPVALTCSPHAQYSRHVPRREQPKFQKIKLANATIARVLATRGVRDVLEACGFAADSTAEHLELVTVEATLLGEAAELVEAAHHMALELHWLHEAVASIGRLSWAAEAAAELVVRECFVALHAPAEEEARGMWVARVHHMLSAVEMCACRAVISRNEQHAVSTLCTVALELIRGGGLDRQALVQCNKCIALLWPAGERQTLDERLEFCAGCLEAALPADDELSELKLRLVRGSLLASTVEALGGFSEMGVRCGVLKQVRSV